MIDPMTIGLNTLSTSKGEKRISLKEVPAERNSTIDEIEITCAQTLVVTEPRANGYFAVGAAR